MKNTKEIKSILIAILCINRTNGNTDNDIEKLCDYAFRRLFGTNTNLLTLACIQRTKEEMMPELLQILGEETQYLKYWEEYTNEKGTY